MDDDGPGRGSWVAALLALACCGGPLLVLLGAAALPAAWSWITAEGMWLVPAVALLVPAAYLVWLRGRPPRPPNRPADPAEHVARRSPR